MTEKLASANADLERDALNQVALQNENQSLREELDFKEKLYLKSRTTIESISLTRSEEEIEEEYRLYVFSCHVVDCSPLLVGSTLDAFMMLLLKCVSNMKTS